MRKAAKRQHFAGRVRELDGRPRTARPASSSTVPTTSSLPSSKKVRPGFQLRPGVGDELAVDQDAGEAGGEDADAVARRSRSGTKLAGQPRRPALRIDLAVGDVADQERLAVLHRRRDGRPGR